jgi:hypothetical protein
MTDNVPVITGNGHENDGFGVATFYPRVIDISQ